MSRYDKSFVAVRMKAHGGNTRRMQSISVEVGRAHPRAMSFSSIDEALQVIERWLRDEWKRQNPPAKDNPTE